MEQLRQEITNESNRNEGNGTISSAAMDDLCKIPFVEQQQPHHQLQQQQQSKCCFTSIQPHSKLIWTVPPTTTTTAATYNHSPPITTVRLCPSMDLIAYLENVATDTTNNNNNTERNHQNITSSASSSSVVLHVHRTLNWQSIATVTSTSTSSSPRHDDDDDHHHHPNNNTTTTTTTTLTPPQSQSYNGQKQMMVWSPDGRSIAVAIANTVHVYSVEGLLLVATSPTGTTATTDAAMGTMDTASMTSAVDTDSNTEHGMMTSGNGTVLTLIVPPVDVVAERQSNSATLTTKKLDGIASISWVHLGSWWEHSDWPNRSDPLLPQQLYYYNTDYLNRDLVVLPPSNYNYYYHNSNNNHHQHHNLGHANGVPDGTPMSNALTTNGPAIRSNNDTTTTASMSLLCVLTCSGHVSMYLHGQYPIVLNIPLRSHEQLQQSRSNTTTTTTITTTEFHPLVSSPDVTHFITAATVSSATPTVVDVSTTEITILSFSALSRHRDSYERITSLYSQAMYHMETIRSSITELIATWKSSVKPMDLKLDGLQKLLINYGLLAVVDSKNLDNDDTMSRNSSISNQNSMRSLLVQYMLSGHTTQNSTGTSTLSNAIDQFFTSVPMNDQLIQRMGVTLFSTMANLESTTRKLLVAPATALVHVIDQLYGLSAYRTELFESTTGETTTSLQLLHASQQLLLAVSMALTTLIEARSRVRNLVAWLRSTGANIKARGTAANSVQRENAKKRRISESLIRQLLSYLQELEFRKDIGSCTTGYVGLTETILKLQFAETLRESSLDQKENHRPTPSHTNKGYQPQQQQHDLFSSSVCIPQALQTTSCLADVVFELPRSLLFQSMKRTTIRLPDPTSADAVQDVRRPSPSKDCLTITTRLGQGGIDPHNIPFGDNPPNGYFSPRVSPQHHLQATSVRQWLVVAAQSQSNLIRLHAFPLSWTNTGDDEFDDDDSDMSDGLQSKSKMTVELRLPDDCTVREIAFYSDDGKSTLSSSSPSISNFSDIGIRMMGGSSSGQEGRQSLGILISRKSNLHTVTHESVELWLVSYDDLEYTHEPIDADPFGSDSQCFSSTNESSTMATISCYSVLPIARTEDDDPTIPDKGNVSYARTRNIFDAVDFSSLSNNDSSTCHLVLSGSRGIGAVLLNQNGSTSLEILDVEDDEEEEEDDDDDDDNTNEDMVNEKR